MKRLIILLFTNLMMFTVIAQTSIKELEEAAKNGDATAQLNLGLSYMDGIDIKQNDKKAFEWLLKAANQGKIEAYIPIARMIDQKRISGFKQKDLYGWLNRAANSEDAGNLIKVADEYLRLSGDESKAADKSRNKTRAFELYEKAYNLTTDTALKKEVAARYRSYNGLTKTINLYKEIAEMGDAEAQYIYGKYYYDLKDYDTAYPWLKNSYDQGYTPVKEIYLDCERIHEQERIAAEKKEAEEKAKIIANEKALADIKDKLHDYVFTTTVPFSQYAPLADAFLDLSALMITEVVIFSLEKGKLIFGQLTAIDRDRVPRNVTRGKLLQQQLIANKYNRETNTYKFNFSDNIFSFTEVYIDDGKANQVKHQFKYDKEKDMLYDVDHNIYLEKKTISEFRKQ